MLKDKVLLFYTSLDDNLKNEIIDTFNFPNRDQKRKFAKIKNVNDKLEKILSSKALRFNFADHAFNIVSDKIPFDFTISYEDLIDSINNETAEFYTIFFFRWCYEYGDDGVCNDDRYFSSFVHSTLFDNIINHKPINIKQASVDNSQEDSSMKLLGYIEQRTTYYNFFPKYKLEQEHFVEITNDELRKLFPTEGGINLAYTYSGKSRIFLENHSTDTDSDLFVKSLYCIEFDSSQLEQNENDRYTCKLDIEKISNTGNLNRFILKSNEVNVYKVVEPESFSISTVEFANNRLIFIKDSNVIEGESVVLLFENKYYGPFDIHLRTQDNKFYIKTDAKERNYLVTYFSEEVVEKIEFEKQSYFEDPHYTNFVHLVGEVSYEDVITDEVLLESVMDNLSIDLAKANPEEFVRKCKNSPFFTDDDVSQARKERLDKIIANTDSYREEKNKLFENLSKLYEKELIITNDKTIQDSELYQSLQYKYNEERRKNDENERNLQLLREENTKLSSQISEQTNLNKTNVSDEQVRQYEEKIRVLEDSLGQVNQLEKIQENIEKLETRQQELETNNKYLLKQSEEYKKEIEQSQNDISNAIKKGTKDVAGVAFNPFISNEMLKAAANWNNEEESRSYIRYKEKISSVNASNMSGKSIIDYIVGYVQERRTYKYNDIINIYVSIAQNFITIFSGEPGTGKTSICSIIGETLGLCNSDPDLNRFVPVSVERGWSSKRDFIGYFNPLTKKYDKSNSKIYDALMKLDAEKDDSLYPFFIMLDEANLSPIEYYWADFMRLTDRSSYSDSYVNIGIERELYVPKTLRFLATINTDQTTESLSPRLIDRACIIKLPKVEPTPQPQNIKTELVSWDNFYEAFGSETELSSATIKLLKEIYDIFNNFGMNVSPRIQLGIEKYIKVAQNIMIEEDGAITSEIAIDYAIIQKLLPKVSGLYSSYERFFDLLKQLCKDHHLNRTMEALQKMEFDQERNMGYCQYFI